MKVLFLVDNPYKALNPYTSTLIDGDAISTVNELNKLKALQLIECNKLEDSYIWLKYKIIR